MAARADMEMCVNSLSRSFITILGTVLAHEEAAAKTNVFFVPIVPEFLRFFVGFKESVAGHEEL